MKDLDAPVSTREYTALLFTHVNIVPTECFVENGALLEELQLEKSQDDLEAR